MNLTDMTLKEIEALELTCDGEKCEFAPLVHELIFRLKQQPLFADVVPIQKQTQTASPNMFQRCEVTTTGETKFVG